VAKYAQHVNPAFVRLLGTFGYGRVFVRARAARVWDDQGHRPQPARLLRPCHAHEEPMRYFLVDKVTAYEAGKSASGIKNVTLSDEVLHDHFPDYPILPGALIVEALAQLAGFAIEIESDRPKERAILAQIERAKFHAPVGPGDQLRLEVRVEQRLEAAARVHGEAFVGDRVVARAELTFMLKTIESERLHEQRRALYRLWLRELSGEGMP
jgi:3-hydroxyacyl-[acyl-carrier-protein] dehydratase